MLIHIARNGERYGPYTIDQIRELLSEGSLLPTDLAYNEESAEWIPLSHFEESSVTPTSLPHKVWLFLKDSVWPFIKSAAKHFMLFLKDSVWPFIKSAAKHIRSLAERFLRFIKLAWVESRSIDEGNSKIQEEQIDAAQRHHIQQQQYHGAEEAFERSVVPFVSVTDIIFIILICGSVFSCRKIAIEASRSFVGIDESRHLTAFAFKCRDEPKSGWVYIPGFDRLVKSEESRLLAGEIAIWESKGGNIFSEPWRGTDPDRTRRAVSWAESQIQKEIGRLNAADNQGKKWGWILTVVSIVLIVGLRWMHRALE